MRPTNSDKFCQSCGVETKSNQDLCVECGTLLTKHNATAATSESSKYAGFWLRFVAILIDGFITSIPVLIISFIVAFNEFNNAYNSYGYYEPDSSLGWAYLSGFAINLLYFAGHHSSKWQATLGKNMMGIKVTDLKGNRISFLRAFGRLLGIYISGLILYIGYIMAGITDKKQALHDKMASTLVVKE